MFVLFYVQPDEAELDIALEDMQNNKPYPNLQINSLLRKEDSEGESETKERGQLNFFQFLFGGNSGTVQKIDGVQMYIIIVASAQVWSFVLYFITIECTYPSCLPRFHDFSYDY